MLRHYLIIKSEGIPLFSFTNKLYDPHYTGKASEFNPKHVEKPILFSGLLSSFVSFSKELGGSLRQIKLDNIDLYMFEKNSLIGVTLADPTNEPEEVEEYKEVTEIVMDRFIREYQEELLHWDGNITKFSHFKDKIKDIKLLSGDLEVEDVCKECIVDCCSSLNTDMVNQ